MQARTVPGHDPSGVAAEPRIVAFVCANCARAGAEPAARKPRPAAPAIPWPAPTRQVLLPCTGKLLPEHILKAFEGGADVVCVVACAEDNCHHIEGSRRAARRIEYVRGLLDELGLGGGRLMLCHLGGSARQDLALGAGARPAGEDDDLAARVEAIGAEVAERLRTLPPNALAKSAEADGATGKELD